MEGIVLAAQRRQDNDISLAWHIAAFSGAAQAGKLKSLDRYIKPDKEPVPQSPDDMLEAMRALQAMGAPMTITEIN